MAEQHVKLFQGLGLSQELIDKIEAVPAEQAKDWNPETISPEVRAALKGTLKNDFLNDAEFLNSIPEEKVPETVKKKIESGQYTRFQKELLEAATKQLGLEDTDLSDLSEEDRKSIKKTVVKIAEKHLGKKGSVEGARQLQQEVTRLTGELEAKDTAWQEKLNTELQSVNGKTSTKLIKAFTRAELQGLSGVELGVKAGYITDPVLAKLTAKYTVTLTDNDELTLRQKNDPNLEVLEDGKPVTFQDALKKVVLEEGLGKVKDGKDEDEKKVSKKIVVGSGENGTVEIGSTIADKIKANQELEGK